MLQLLASGTLSLKVNNDNGKGRLVLNFRVEDSMPCYMIDDPWNGIDIVPNADLVHV